MNKLVEVVRLLNEKSQREFANMLKVSVPTYRKWEEDIDKMPAGYMKVLHEKLGVTPNELLLKGETGISKSPNSCM